MKTDVKKNIHYLYPAAIFSSREPTVVTTVLGSCIAVCLWDRYQKTGGVNHYMLPLWNGEGLSSPKYGNIAITKLIEKMERSGSKRHNIIAKVFGGSTRMQSGQNHFQIGKRNYKIAEQLLKENNIPIISYSVGGERGRKIHFHTDTGEVFMKLLPDFKEQVRG